MRTKKLTIISDTPMYQLNDDFFAFGPVVREIEFIEYLFDEITWVGFNRTDKIGDLSMQKIDSSKIKLVFLKPVGGKGVFSFVNVVFQYPIMFFRIVKYICKSDIIHTRAPSHPALIALLSSFLFQKKIWWNKFAGNWNQHKPPYSYGFQKLLMLKATFSKVTLNGFWSDQPAHCFSFENPCLTKGDIDNGIEICTNKNFSPPFIFSFVGRLETPKGVDRILEALATIPPEIIKEIHFVGDGNQTESYIKNASFLNEKVKFHGFLNKKGVHDLLAKSHFFLLPSTASEGFPKVIAEAACYGTIPVVSDVSSIPHYINLDNGFLWNIDSNKSFSTILNEVIKTDCTQLKVKSINALKIAKQFTFDNYVLKLKGILNFK